MESLQRKELIPLRLLLNEGKFSKKAIERALNAFQCERDSDIHVFLKQRALPNETAGATRTYLIVDYDAYEQDILSIVAFFALAIVSTDFSSVSDEDRKSILGKVPGLRTNSHFPGYLISHFARDDRYSNEQIPGRDIMEVIEDIVIDASAAVGGSTMYLDCRDCMISYYSQYGYIELYRDDETELNKMVKKVPLA